MDITPLIKSDQQVIQSYAGGVFKVSGVAYSQAVFVFPNETAVWNAGDFESLSVADFEILIARSADIDVVLLGCGAKMRFLKPELRAALKARGLSVDVMDSGAACRTYNVLMAEGRRVVAALLPSV